MDCEKEEDDDKSSSNNNKRSGSPIADENGSSHTSKRYRPTENNNNDGETRPHILPPEMWAGVMEILPFDDVLSCGATCRTMLHNAIPLLKEIRIDNAKQMNLTVASRFRDVKTIHINSLLSLVWIDGDDGQYTEVAIDLETKIRVVPFLSRLTSLERVHFGGKDEDGDMIDRFAPTTQNYTDSEDGIEGSRQGMSNFITELSGAFAFGLLPNHLHISGLCCPELNQGMVDNDCKTCIRACKSFPLQSVVEFECRGTSVGNAQSGRMFGLDVCLDRAQIESIIESRPGGHELLYSDARLMRLLGNGRRYVMSDERKSLYVVKYKQEELEEIKRVIEYAELDVKKLSMRKVSNAVMKSFTKEENGQIPSKNQRFFTKGSLDYLVKDIGLPIDREDFDRPSLGLLEDIPLITKGLWENFDQTDEDDEDDEEEANDVYVANPKYIDIEIDCLKLIHRLIKYGGRQAMEKIAQTPTVNLLVKYLGFADSYKMEAAICLYTILKVPLNSSTYHRQIQMVIDAGAVPLFVKMLDFRLDSIAKVAVLSLACMICHQTKTVGKVVNAGGIPKLLSLLDSKEVVCVGSSLRLLVTAAAHDSICYTRRTVLLRHLVRIMKAKIFSYWEVADQKLSLEYKFHLTNCMILLRKIFEAENPPIQSMISLSAVPTLFEITKATVGHNNIQANLSHVMASILSGATTHQTNTLLMKKGTIDLLKILVVSQNNDISKKALAAVESVAQKSAKCCDLLVNAGIMKCLLQLLRHSNTERSRLSAAIRTYAECCQGTTDFTDFAATKAALLFLSRMIFIQYDTDVLYHSCLALHHTLDGLERGQINEVIGMGFVEHLLKILPTAPLTTQISALKSIHLISMAGDTCIKAILDVNGISYLSKALSRSDVVKQDRQDLACRSMYNIILYDRDQIQTAIDNNAVPELVQILQSDNCNALVTIQEIAKAGTTDQVRCLVSNNCIQHLCEVLDSEWNSATIALQALKDVSERMMLLLNLVL